MIEQILMEEETPDELKYLALIESGLNPRARSPVGAAGIWQFMPATGREYGLVYDTWVDERLDPEKATRAAAQYLKSLYGMYGDWHLALAAYNCGPGNVNKAVARLRRSSPGAAVSFWSLYRFLPKETRNYVPMYIATALVASNPEAYGATRSTDGPTYAYDLVTLPGRFPLDKLAELSGAGLPVLKALNPALRRSVLPPSPQGYAVRIPLGSYQKLAARLSRQDLDIPQMHIVAAGETLLAVATQYGSTTDELMALNGLKHPRIREGMRLRLPSGAPNLAETARPVRVRYGVRAYEPLKPAQSRAKPAVHTPGRPYAEPSSPEPAAPTDTLPNPGTLSKQQEPDLPAAEKSVPTKDEATPSSITYIVRRGDTLGNIAKRYGVTISDIQSWNGLPDDHIEPGWRLLIYTDGKPHPGKPVRARQSSRRTTRRVSTTPSTPERTRRVDYPAPPQPARQTNQERILEMGKEYGRRVLRERLDEVLNGRRR